VCIEVRELAVLRDGRRAAGNRQPQPLLPVLLPGQLGDPATACIEWLIGGNAARGEPVSGDRVRGSGGRRLSS